MLCVDCLLESGSKLLNIEYTRVYSQKHAGMSVAYTHKKVW